MKAVKIALISIGVLIVLIIAALFIIPRVFKDEIREKAISIINENVNAKVNFSDVDLSIFRSFPNLSVELKDISVSGIDKFEGDTLVSIASFGATINIMSYLKNDQIDIKSVVIDRPLVKAIVLEDGKTNWDIVKTDSTAQPEVVDTTSSGGLTGFNLELKKFQIKEAGIMYNDMQGKMLAAIDNLNFMLKGNMKEAQTLLNLTSTIERIDLFVGNSHLVNNATLDLKADIDADLENMVFTLKDNEININRMALVADGTIKMPGNDIDLDLTYGLKVPSLKTLLEMIPTSIVQEVKDIDTRGTMDLNGWVKGIYNEKSMPEVYFTTQVKDGYVKYSHLPQSIDNLNIDLNVLFDGNHDEKTKIDLNKFTFTLAGNPFSVNANVRTPMTDMDIKAAMKGKINFKSISDAIPLQEGININGVATADVTFAGRMSAIEKELYDKLQVDGQIELTDFLLKTASFPMDINISKTAIHFTPRYVELKAFDSKVGKSDVHMTGRLENFLNFIFKDDVIKGNLAINSTLIDCNELMGASSTDTEVQDTTATSSEGMLVFVLPKNIDFSMQANLKTVLYDKLKMDNVAGRIGVKDGRLSFDNLGMNAIGGKMSLSGHYFAADNTKAAADINFGLQNVDVATTVESFTVIEQMLPMASAFKGKLTNLSLAFSTTLDKEMSPVLHSINGSGILRADSLELMNKETAQQIAALVKSSNENFGLIKNIKLNFTIKDGNVQIPAFPAKAGNVNMMIGGEHGLDQIVNYQVDMQIPAGSVGKAADDLLAKATGIKGISTGIKTIPMGVAITGTINKPTFKLATPKWDFKNVDTGTDASEEVAAPSVTDQVKSSLTDQLTKKLGGDSTQNSAVNEVTNKAVDALNNLFKKKKK